MYNIVDAIYQMLGSGAGGEDESPRERVDKIFEQLDKVRIEADTAQPLCAKDYASI